MSFSKKKVVPIEKRRARWRKNSRKYQRKLRLKKYSELKEQQAKLRSERAQLRRKTVQEKRVFIQGLKSQPCKDCSNSYPSYVMHFDHLPENGQKRFQISKGHEKSWDALKLEISKCELVCANCHAIRTYQRNNPQVN